MAENDAMNVVRLVFDNASEEEGDGQPPKNPPPVDGDGGLPRELGVTALGVLGDRAFFLDSNAQLRALKPEQLSRQGIKSLCGAKSHLIPKHFPRYSAKTNEILGADYDEANTAFISAAARRGVFDPSDRVRGPGAWRGDAGELVLNCGTAICVGGRWYEPGIFGRHVYPGGKALPRPWDTSVSAGARGPGQRLLAMLESWSWRRVKLDARLLLGFIGASMIGGALDWRVVVWVTGGRSTGKSTLHRLLERVFGGALVAVSDASAAGIWQKLGHATLPVVLDEVEAEEDNRRAQSVVKLARQAASGGLVLRGGADHGAAEFVARSCFLFSSILMPPLLGQDRSRIAILELGEIGRAAPPPDLEARALAELGEKSLRLLVEGWSRWPDTLALFRQALMAVGHNARGADLFGTLLAAADLLLHAELPDHDTVRELAEQLETASLAEADDDASDQERCLQHLLTQALPLEASANKRPVAEWLAVAAVADAEIRHEPERQAFREEARRMLGRYGLKVQQEGTARYLGIAAAHAELGKLFTGTHWAGRSGATGVWTQSLRRLSGSRPSRKSMWFAGSTAKGTLVPIELALVAPEAQDKAPAPVERALSFDGPPRDDA